jgi:hypothetical protein
MTPPAFLLASFYNSASLADGPITLGVTLLERTAATELALSLPFIQSCRQRTSLQPKRAGADNGGLYRSSSIMADFIATAMDFAVMVELKMLGRDVDETWR